MEWRNPDEVRLEQRLKKFYRLTEHGFRGLMQGLRRLEVAREYGRKVFDEPTGTIGRGVDKLDYTIERVEAATSPGSEAIFQIWKAALEANIKIEVESDLERVFMRALPAVDRT